MYICAIRSLLGYGPDVAEVDRIAVPLQEERSRIRAFTDSTRRGLGQLDVIHDLHPLCFTVMRALFTFWPFS